MPAHGFLIAAHQHLAHRSFSAYSSSSNFSGRPRRRKLPWVPVAYRGERKIAAEDSNGAAGGGGTSTSSSSRFSRRTALPVRSWRRGVGPRATTSTSSSNRRGNEERHHQQLNQHQQHQPRGDGAADKYTMSEDELRAMRERKRRLLVIYQHVIKNALEYRQAIRSPTPSSSTFSSSNAENAGEVELEEGEHRVVAHSVNKVEIASLSDDEKRELLSYEDNVLADRIRNSLDGLQEADGPVDDAKLKSTHVAFNALCKGMHHMGMTASALANHAKNDRAYTFYIAMAETILVEFVKLLKERCLLVEAARKSAEQGDNNNQHQQQSAGDKETTMIEVQPAAAQHLHNTTPLAPAGKLLDEWAQQLLSSIVTAIVSHTTRNLRGNNTVALSSKSSELSLADRRKFEVTAERVLGVLETMPTSWDATSDALMKTVQLLAEAASYKSAQKCRLIFERHGTAAAQGNEHMRMSSVLLAYLAAVQQTIVPDEIPAIIDEAYDFLIDNWKRGATAVSNERLQAVAVMLRIIAFTCRKLNKTDKEKEDKEKEEIMIMYERADSLLQLAIGNESAAELLRQLEKKDSDISVQLTPLLDPLALLYASSGDSERVELARKMLDHMMKNVGKGRFFAYPTTKTCNVVLKTMVDKYCDERIDEKEAQSEQDLLFSSKLLSFMYKQTEAACTPDRVTLEQTMNLLDVANLADAGPRAQKILSVVESYYLLSESSEPGVPLALYHRVLNSWLATASRQDGASDVCCAEQALWMVERMELRSTPVFLSDKLLKASAYPYIYDTEARPTEQTYGMMLQICVATTNNGHFHKAAEIALRVSKKLVTLEAFDSRHSGQLRSCSDKIPKESDLWKEIDSFFFDVADRLSHDDADDILSDSEEEESQAEEEDSQAQVESHFKAEESYYVFEEEESQANDDRSANP